MSDCRMVMLRCCTAFTTILLACLLSPRACAQTDEKPDLTRQPTLYVVGYAHLDTEWRWEYPQVINEYIRKTMEDNFKLPNGHAPMLHSFYDDPAGLPALAQGLCESRRKTRSNPAADPLRRSRPGPVRR